MDEFPDKPIHMHRRTYERLRHTYNSAHARCTLSLTRFIDRLDRKVRVRPGAMLGSCWDTSAPVAGGR